MKTFLKVFAIILVVIILVGLFLDNKINITREIEIQASPQEIHRYISDLNQWTHWNPWVEMDPTIKTTIGEVSSGVGASQSWTGESGSGALTLTESSVDGGIVYSMTFDGDPAVYMAGMRYSPTSNGTRVTWYMTGEMQPIIIGNYFSLIMDSLVGPSFETGLANLKKVVEK